MFFYILEIYWIKKSTNVNIIIDIKYKILNIKNIYIKSSKKSE